MPNQFEKAMEHLGVTPIGETPKVTLDKPKPKPSNRNATKADQQVLTESISENPLSSMHAVESEEELQKPGLQNRDFTRLKQGKIHREAELFLRGYTVEKAINLLKQFVQQSVMNGHRCIKIVHGKGMNSPDGISRIKLECHKLLTLNKLVLGYTRAQPNDGGSGATYALLKKRRN